MGGWCGRVDWRSRGSSAGLCGRCRGFRSRSPSIEPVDADVPDCSVPIRKPKLLPYPHVPHLTWCSSDPDCSLTHVDHRCQCPYWNWKGNVQGIAQRRARAESPDSRKPTRLSAASDNVVCSTSGLTNAAAAHRRRVGRAAVLPASPAATWPARARTRRQRMSLNVNWIARNVERLSAIVVSAATPPPFPHFRFDWRAAHCSRRENTGRANM